MVHTCVWLNWDKLVHLWAHMRTWGLEMLLLRTFRFWHLFLVNEDVRPCSESSPYRCCPSPASLYSTTSRRYCTQPWKQTQTAPRRSLWPPEWWSRWCASSSPDQPGNSTRLNLSPFKSNNKRLSGAFILTWIHSERLLLAGDQAFVFPCLSRRAKWGCHVKLSMPQVRKELEAEICLSETSRDFIPSGSEQPAVFE